MGQRENSNRHASLDEEKERGAGRADRSPEREAIKDAMDPVLAKGSSGGAFGADRGDDDGTRGSSTQGGGGGGGAQSPAKDNHLTTGASKVSDTGAKNRYERDETGKASRGE